MRYAAINDYHYSSFRNALRILNLFSIEEPELQLENIANRLEIGQSTAFRLTHSLMAEGFIVRDSSAKSYRLAASLLSFGHTLLRKETLCHLSIDIIEKLAEKTGETAHLGIFNDCKVLYLLKMDSAHPVHLLSHAGSRNSLHCTSTGQILLAFQEESVIERVLMSELTPFTSKTITDANKLKNLLLSIKTKGMAVSKEELHEGVVSVSVPVLNRKRECIAAVSIAGPSSRINDRSIPKLTKQLQDAAEEVSRKLQNSREPF
ncbi:IclR family transcriptional regulator [Bacillus sp. USDA818B3_A]|uniref:IclR family transcriptional regulator n=1 Tax=Bacillus sp. USDA818B3_A TaxID=2698834 RepID=UPI001371AF0C|nr:IclR family transcriptional regulator [Bacillus sp. USDA818B3_A]